MTTHLELGYAQTSHANEGRTVDTALVLFDTPTDSRGIYTPMTRGREANHACVVTEDNQTSLDLLTQGLTREWIDQPALARMAQLDPYRTRQLTLSLGGEDHELAELEQRIRRLIAQRRVLTQEAERYTGRSPHCGRETSFGR